MDQTLLILEKVNSFYSNSWTQLIAYTVGLLAFCGALIPLIINFYQNRQFKKEQEIISRNISEEINKQRQSIIEEIKEEIKSDLNKYNSHIKLIESKFEKKLAATEGGSFHVQADNEYARDLYTGAAISFCESIGLYIVAEEEMNLQRVIVSLVNILSNDIYLQDYEEDQILKTKINETITKIEKFNKNGRYTDSIDNIKKQLSNSLKRKRPTTESQSKAKAI